MSKMLVVRSKTCYDRGDKSKRSSYGERDYTFGQMMLTLRARIGLTQAGLASSGEDNAIRVWDASTGASAQILQDSDHVDTIFHCVAWSPDGQWLATGSLQQGVQVWEVTTGRCRWVGRTDAPVRMESGWHSPGQLRRCWQRLAVGGFRRYEARAIPGASGRGGERSLESRWDTTGKWERVQRHWGALRLGCAQWGASI